MSTHVDTQSGLGSQMAVRKDSNENNERRRKKTKAHFSHFLAVWLGKACSALLSGFQ